ncbi:MAG TPA: hypothetical protein VF723_11345 [Pyrinomonadaceae bacterium]
MAQPRRCSTSERLTWQSGQMRGLRSHSKMTGKHGTRQITSFGSSSLK